MKTRYIFQIFLICLFLLVVSFPAFAIPQLKIGVGAEKMSGTARLNLSLNNNNGTYAGVNAKIVLPDGVSVTSVSKGDLLSSDFSLDYHSGGNTVTVLAYSSRSSISGNGVLLSLDLDSGYASPGTYEIFFGSNSSIVNSRCALSDPDGNSVSLTPENGYLAIGHADEDEDGLPDALEQAIADSNPYDSFNSIYNIYPRSDFDGDGSSNWAEYHNMTDPTDDFSLLQVVLGDLDDDEDISLKDAISALQILCGISVYGINSEAAVNGYAIGMEDAIHALQITAETRD